MLSVGLAAQEPPDSLPPPDTIVRDTTGALLDSLQTVPDSLADSVVVRNLPPMRTSGRPGSARSVWAWTLDDLMGLRDLTLVELLEDVPGVIPLRGGDYGAPEGVTSLGMGAGRVRVFWDGVEWMPLDGSVPDLAMVALAGLEEVRVERGPGEIRIHLRTLGTHDPRPVSIVEAGTGDLETNFFRGTFVSPRAPGGNIAFSLERIDTRGRAGRETGNRTGWWVRYGFHPSDRWGVVASARHGARSVEADAYPGGVSRTDWNVRARATILDGLVGELFAGGASLTSDDDTGLVPLDESRSQQGARLAWERDPAWVTASWRRFGSVDLPASTLEVEGGAEDGALGGVRARWSRERWEERVTASSMAQLWTRAVAGLSAFASWSDGERGERIFRPRMELPPEDDGTGEVPGDETQEEPTESVEEPTHRFSERSAFRVGARFAWRGLQLEGARLRVEQDSVAPLGHLNDRGGAVTALGERAGWEASAVVPLPVDGFSLTGSYQVWDSAAVYLPRRVYAAAVRFHDIFYESGDLEVWSDLGVRGWDPVLVPWAGTDPDADPETQTAAVEGVPFYQSWYVDIQARIVTFNLFIRWENFTVRRNLQTYPERLLPETRTIYGIRWTLWN